LTTQKAKVNFLQTAQHKSEERTIVSACVHNIYVTYF